MWASAIVAPLLSSASASRSFRTICSGLCRFFILESFPPQESLDSHSTWLSCSGAGHGHRMPPARHSHCLTACHPLKYSSAVVT
jgi:hypothetical protein